MLEVQDAVRDKRELRESDSDELGDSLSDGDKDCEELRVMEGVCKIEGVVVWLGETDWEVVAVDETDCDADRDKD
jgi:uncharacterized membrane-anchored protein